MFDIQSGTCMAFAIPKLMCRLSELPHSLAISVCLQRVDNLESAAIQRSLRALRGVSETRRRQQLLGCAQPGPNGLGITLADFDPSAWNRWVTGDFKGLTLKTSSDLSMSKIPSD
eukprot:6461947-Amphidinium_carterae.1